MTREQELRARIQARKAAFDDLRNDREASEARAAWWVGELSHKLGIVDAHGMIDVDGEIARLFCREYRRIYAATPRAIGVGS